MIDEIAPLHCPLDAQTSIVAAQTGLVEGGTVDIGGCPLWVISGHVQRTGRRPLSAISKHQADVEFTRPVGAPSLEYLRGDVVRVEPDNVQNRSQVIPCAIHMGSSGNDGVGAVTVGRLSTEV